MLQRINFDLLLYCCAPVSWQPSYIHVTTRAMGVVCGSGNMHRDVFQFIMEYVGYSKQRQRRSARHKIEAISSSTRQTR
eukprot:c26287_g1_i2 orf=171-407(+)